MYQALQATFLLRYTEQLSSTMALGPGRGMAASSPRAPRLRRMNIKRSPNQLLLAGACMYMAHCFPVRNLVGERWLAYGDMDILP